MLVLRVTGRATYAIEKKLITGQRAVSAFGGMKTSEARAKGLTGLKRDLGAENEKTGSSRWSEWDAGEQGLLHLDGSTAEKEIEPGPRMQEFWGAPPTQEQYAEGRKGYGGEKGWQDKFEKSWIHEAEVASELAANRTWLCGDRDIGGDLVGPVVCRTSFPPGRTACRGSPAGRGRGL